MCSPEREAPRKGFGMSFLQTIGCDLKGKDGSVVHKMGAPKPRGVCFLRHSCDGPRASANESIVLASGLLEPSGLHKGNTPPR